jgi:glycylpeptide N-tetradecanoyltransferase
MARMIRLFKLPETPHLVQLGLREMEERDVADVSGLFSRYMQRFHMAPEMTEDEVRHQFLSGRGEDENGDSHRRKGQVVWSYVVEVDLCFSRPG